MDGLGEVSVPTLQRLPSPNRGVVMAGTVRDRMLIPVLQVPFDSRVGIESRAVIFLNKV